MKQLQALLQEDINVSTIRQVAEAAGVSIATVSRVINNSSVVTEEVRRKVLEAVNQCGYVPSVSRRHTALLALIYTGPFSLGSSYDMALVEGIGQATNSLDFDLVVLNPLRDRNPDETFTQYFLRKGVRGVILRSTVEGRSICEEIAAENFPAVVVGDRFQHPDLCFIYADSFPTSKQAIEHLLTLGHRRIAFAANETEDADHIDRYRGYCEAIQQSGLEPSSDLLFRVPAHRPDGAQLLRTLMSAANTPTAVYVTDPAVAVGLLNEAHSMQMEIPQDLSVVGFDDRDARFYVHPQMTAVCQDAIQLGYQAFDQLARIVQSGEARGATFKPPRTWLEINQTTSPPRAGEMRVLHDGTRLRVESH